MFYFLHLHTVLLRLITYYARHTFITDKRSEGHSYETINDSVGNKSIEMTRGYVDASKLGVLKQISKENMRKFIDSVDKV